MRLGSESMSRPQEPGEGGSSVNGERKTTKTLTWAESVELLDSAPGVDKRAAEIVLAETGIDMGQFPSADHLTAWAGLAPGNNQSGSKRRRAKTREGNRNLRQIMVQIAWAASRKKGSYAQSLYRRLAGRRGKKRAIIAVARTLLESFYYMLSRAEPYRELGGDYFNKRRKDVKVNVLTKQLEKLGYAVQLEPVNLQPVPG
jgi:transposase